jgi:hypothetical protein
MVNVNVLYKKDIFPKCISGGGAYIFPFFLLLQVVDLAIFKKRKEEEKLLLLLS